MKNTKQKPASLMELDIESIGFEGVAIAKHEGQVVFVKGGVPGDKVVANVRQKRKSYSEGTIKEVLTASQHRCKPFCEYFGACGGCS